MSEILLLTRPVDLVGNEDERDAGSKEEPGDTLIVIDGDRRGIRHEDHDVGAAYGNLGHTLFPLALYVDLLPTWLAYLALPGALLYELVTLYLLVVLIKSRLHRSY